MIGCLMFLGCPFRMLLRIAGGDLNAWAGLVGFAGGIYAGIFFLNRGYSLKRTYKMTTAEGSLLPAAALALLALLITAPAFIHPCYFGTSLPDPEQLAAYGRTEEEVCRLIGADSLQYLPVEDLAEIAGELNIKFCDACFTGHYAVPVPRQGTSRKPSAF